MFSRTAGNTGNSRELLVIPGNYWDISYSLTKKLLIYEGISKSFEPNMERARNLDLFCFIFQRSPLPTPHTCPI